MTWEVAANEEEERVRDGNGRERAIQGSSPTAIVPSG